MPAFTVNDLPVLEGSVRLPRIGVWHADLKLDAHTLPTGALTLAHEDKRLLLKGTLVRGKVEHDTAWVRIAGGAGGLSKMPSAKFYEQVPLRLPLSDLLREAGETLASSSDSGLLQTPLPAWTRFQATASFALHALLAQANCAWRILPQGVVWVGKDAWTQAQGPFEIL